MTPSKPNYPITGSPVYTNPTEAQENYVKFNLINMIEASKGKQKNP